MNLQQFRNTLNKFGKQNLPFFFLVDFELNHPLCFPLNEIPEEFAVQTPVFSCNLPTFSAAPAPLQLRKFPMSFDEYSVAFQKVQKALKNGDTYLLNLTFPTKIRINWTLEEIFTFAKAPYKLLRRQQWVLFSPEPFVKISQNLIKTFPMKGTIDAQIKDAPKKLLENPKELYEHYTITDLLRNDLAQVARNIKVVRFRYLEKISAHYGEIWQTSSEIVGELPENWNEFVGDIILKLLPAGSVSGAPKKRTLEVIRNAEQKTRNFYTGIFGIYSNKSLDSAVNIRFIEQKNSEKFFRSGGGITALSTPEEEFSELLKKVYVPFNGNS